MTLNKVGFNLAIFASGSGSNAQKIMAHFADKPNIRVSILFSNNPNAGAIQHAKNNKIESLVFNKNEFYNTDSIIDHLKSRNIDLIVLAGFLWLIPENLIEAFPNRILNIHPALLPDYGGKGMYGHHVHQAVFENMETESGITIHLVNKEYDRGKILYQEKVSLDVKDTPDIIASKVLSIEHRAYPSIIEKYALQLMNDQP